MFNLSMRHKINKINIISNILLRFQERITIITKNDLKVLKALYK